MPGSLTHPPAYSTAHTYPSTSRSSQLLGMDTGLGIEAEAQAGPSRSTATAGAPAPTALVHPNIISGDITSPSAVALISLTQDISALLSISLEATASLVHDWFRVSLSKVGLGGSEPRPARSVQGPRGEAGRGLAVVVIGSAEPTGQSLSLHLARSGYTVFPFLPLPSPSSPPSPASTQSALSHLLLTWSGIQKRLRARQPNHPGCIVPIITDHESPRWTKDIKGKDRFRHAGETVRAYLRENGLDLVAVVCATQSSPHSALAASALMPGSLPHPLHYDSEYASLASASPRATNLAQWSPGTDLLEVLPSPVPPTPPVLPNVDMDPIPTSLELVPMPDPRGLLGADESALIGLYRANVLDPLTAIRELRDLLVPAPGGKGRGGRLVFVNALPDEAEVDDPSGTVLKVITAARAEVARVLRDELGGDGVDVCEVVVGPMDTRRQARIGHARHGSDESSGTDGSARPLLHASSFGHAPIESGAENADRDAVLASRLRLLARLWAVDDALLYSSVRRAIQDRYPRYRHHAGLSPLVDSVVDMVPGARWGRVVGRWLLGRLLSPRG